MSSDFGFEPTSLQEFYFISYNTEDADRVSEICRLLNDEGMPLWYDYDEEFRNSPDYKSVIAERVDRCIAPIFFITKGIIEKAKKSGERPFTCTEYSFAQKLHKNDSIVVLLDRIDVNDVPYSLSKWWDDINPGARQDILAYDSTPDQIKTDIWKAANYQKAKSITDDINYVVFNSVIDHPIWGDERKFLRIRKDGEQEWHRNCVVEPGSRYEVELFYRNDGNPEYNSKGIVISTNTRVAVFFPPFVSGSTQLEARITWSACPFETQKHVPHNGEARDSIILHEDKTAKHIVKIHPVIAGDRIYNNFKANGSVLSAHLYASEGTPIGCNKLAGTIPAGEEYAGSIRFFFDAE